MSLKKAIGEYLDFIREIGVHYETDEMLEMVTDFEEIRRFCRKTKKRIGIVNRNEFNIHVVDLVRNKKGELLSYERIIKAARGNSIVVIPFRNDKMLLLKQFRHALGTYQYAFLRGFGEAGLSPEENARKEIREELQCSAGDFVRLGTVVADSGLCGEKITVFRCNVDAPQIEEGYEEIASYIELTGEELSDKIRQGEINDGFTLSALTLLREKG